MEALNKIKVADYHYEMSEDNISVSELSFGVGIIGCVSFILYFCVMAWSNFHEILLLRSLNFVILLCCILFALKLHSGAIHSKIDYFTGLSIGIGTTLFAVLPFTLFLTLYLFVDVHFMAVIQQSSGIGKFLNPITAAGSVCIEGLSSGTIITFIAMQYFKSNKH